MMCQHLRFKNNACLMENPKNLPYCVENTLFNTKIQVHEPKGVQMVGKGCESFLSLDL